ncbi:hypothetical protein SLS53_007407 [Cytospora paraplurivora]|uniref:Uncharacterized protein n=1 Tax=Cytospora paraplurivora TaxID=2898453 RepID=A0AAN9YD64_9PEZI
MTGRANNAHAPLPPGSTDILLRRIAAVGLGIFLYFSCPPFTPVSWLTQPDWTTYLDGPRLIDRILGPVVLFGATVLHWYIASQHTPLPLTISVPAATQNNIQDGRLETDTIVLGLWRPSYFWPFAVAEAALLYAVAFESLWEVTARFVVVGILVSVWVLGWNAMPWYRKEQAWALIKDYVVRLIIMEMVNSAFGGGSGGRRRRRRL